MVKNIVYLGLLSVINHGNFIFSSQTASGIEYPAVGGLEAGISSGISSSGTQKASETSKNSPAVQSPRSGVLGVLRKDEPIPEKKTKEFDCCC